LRENGLLRDNQRLSDTSESELEWLKKSCCHFTNCQFCTCFV
jgi:hypothetical protein